MCVSNSTASIQEEPHIFALNPFRICMDSVDMKTLSGIQNVLLKTEKKTGVCRDCRYEVHLVFEMFYSKQTE